MSDKYRASAIVPAYNEEKYISGVLKVLTECQVLDEVICVNDGSIDGTEKKAEKFAGVQLINLPENKGKAFAVSQGVKAVKGEIVLFIDADLVGLKKKSVRKLIKPLLSGGKYKGVVGLPAAGLGSFTFPLSGERAYFKKDLLKHLKKIEEKGYGLELYLNYAYRDEKIKIVEFEEVVQMSKQKKQPYDMALKLMLKEDYEIWREILLQKNPVDFFIHSYLYPFYIKKPQRIRKKVKKLIARIREFQNG